MYLELGTLNHQALLRTLHNLWNTKEPFQNQNLHILTTLNNPPPTTLHPPTQHPPVGNPLRWLRWRFFHGGTTRQEEAVVRHGDLVSVQLLGSTRIDVGVFFAWDFSSTERTKGIDLQKKQVNIKWETWRSRWKLESKLIGFLSDYHDSVLPVSLPIFAPQVLQTKQVSPLAVRPFPWWFSNAWSAGRRRAACASRRANDKCSCKASPGPERRWKRWSSEKKKSRLRAPRGLFMAIWKTPSDPTGYKRRNDEKWTNMNKRIQGGSWVVHFGRYLLLAALFMGTVVCTTTSTSATTVVSMKKSLRIKILWASAFWIPKAPKHAKTSLKGNMFLKDEHHPIHGCKLAGERPALVCKISNRTGQKHRGKKTKQSHHIFKELRNPGCVVGLLWLRDRCFEEIDEKRQGILIHGILRSFPHRAGSWFLCKDGFCQAWEA